MNEIANRLNTYSQSHPFDSGTAVAEQTWTSYIKPTQNPTRTIPRRLVKALYEEIALSFFGSLPEIHW